MNDFLNLRYWMHERLRISKMIRETMMDQGKSRHVATNETLKLLAATPNKKLADLAWQWTGR